LDWRIGDSKVRSFAVSLLEGLTDLEVGEYLTQLVNVVKFEPFHDSALAKFIVSRALRNKTIVGHNLFWLLRAEMHTNRERLGLMLEVFLRGCKMENILFFYQESTLINDIANVAGIIKNTPKEERLDVVHYQLRKLKFPPRFQIPLFSDRENCGLLYTSCRYMKSKKLPLWLVFQNSDPNGDSTYVLYKQGDDLRQDVLTLQLLRLMDRCWIKDQGLDLRLSTYGVISTGWEEGMVEVVLNSETIGAINRAAGGTMAVLKEDVIAKWLQSKNPDPESYKIAVKNFALSCAGYCVATYVLGIGDRHNDNLMIHTDGRLFHIDFGHVLGHFKTKMGIKRERAPMIFTPQMAYVLGGPGAEMYTLFQNRCCQAFMILRKNANLFLTLLNLTLCCDLPEVQGIKDVMWVRDHLHLDLSDSDATIFFLGIIEESLHTVSTQLMDMIHIIAN